MKVYLQNFNNLWILYSKEDIPPNITFENAMRYKVSSFVLHDGDHVDIVRWARKKIPQGMTVEWEL